MAIDSMFLRLAGGNVANPEPPNNKISGHTFIAVLRTWADGEITKAQVIAADDLTHADDSSDLDSLKQWFLSAKAAGLEDKFADVVERRIILARDKRPAGVLNLDGKFGYAVKATFIGGADGAHSLKDTGPMADRFTTWAA